jgi:hypothetical protein
MAQCGDGKDQRQQFWAKEEWSCQHSQDQHPSLAPKNHPYVDCVKKLGKVLSKSNLLLCYLRRNISPFESLIRSLKDLIEVMVKMLFLYLNF